MSIFIAYIFVFLLAAIPFVEEIPVIAVAIAGGLPAFPVTVFAFLGNIATIGLLILLIDKVQKWLQKRREKKGEERSKKRTERAERVWKRFGLPGLALAAPFLIGSHFGVMLAMGFGGKKRQVFFWMTISLVLWAIATGIAAFYGIDFFYSQLDREGFLNNLFITE